MNEHLLNRVEKALSQEDNVPIMNNYSFCNTVLKSRHKRQKAFVYRNVLNVLFPLGNCHLNEHVNHIYHKHESHWDDKQIGAAST